MNRTLGFNSTTLPSLKNIYKQKYSVNNQKIIFTKNIIRYGNEYVKFLIWLLKKKSEAGVFNTKYKKLSEKVYEVYTTHNQNRKNVLREVLKSMGKIKDKSQGHKNIRDVIRQTVYKLDPDLIETEQNKITVNIFWIRHAFSCGNMLEYFKKVIHMPEHTPDTSLSGVGILQATVLGLNPQTRTILKNADFYGCSTLTRTLQTALFGVSGINIPQKNPRLILGGASNKMYVVPYINEKFVNVPGMALKTYVSRSTTPICYFDGVEKHKETFEQIKTQIVENRMDLDWSVYDTIYTEDADCRKESKVASDYDEFLDKILPEIVKKIKVQGKSEYNICLFSHGNYMKKDVLKNPDEGIYNTGIYQKQYYCNQDGSLFHEKMKYTRHYPPRNLDERNLSEDMNQVENVNRNGTLTRFRIGLSGNNRQFMGYELYKDSGSDLCYYFKNQSLPIILTKKHSGEDYLAVQQFYVSHPKVFIGSSAQTKVFSKNKPNRSRNGTLFNYTCGCFANVRKILAPQSINGNRQHVQTSNSLQTPLLLGGTKKEYLFISGIGKRRIYARKNGKEYIRVEGKKINLDKFLN